MPRLKEVESLQRLANHALLTCVVQCCKDLMTDPGDFMELREAVAAIKERILGRIPWYLLADFSASFIDNCAPFVRDEFDGREILGSIMDIEIIGLRLKGPIMRFLKPYDAPRFRKLKELHLYPGQGKDRFGCEAPRMELARFRLDDLTSLRYPHCTDSDLEIIAWHCSNLEVLDICASEDVTDEGLRCLWACPNLRVVRVDRCPKITHVGLSFLLSQLRKLEEFSYGYHADHEAEGGQSDEDDRPRTGTPFLFDMLSGLDFNVRCPTLTSFVYETNLNFSPPAGLRSVVTKFPNLRSLSVNCIGAEDLSTIQDLSKLEKLRVNFVDGIQIAGREQIWQDLLEAFNVIGPNLTSLSLRVYNLRQCIVNSIFDDCPNLEKLNFDLSEYDGVSLEVPPFKKLEEFVVRVKNHDRHTYSQQEKPLVKFGMMSNLEILSLLDVDVDFKLLESMMLDNIKFPKLRVVRTNSVTAGCLARIGWIARDNNLDFRVENRRRTNQHRLKANTDSHQLQLLGETRAIMERLRSLNRDFGIIIDATITT